MHITGNITFGHIRIQNNQAKESKSHPYTFSKKDHGDNCKGAVPMAKISEGCTAQRDTKSLTDITLILSRQTFLRLPTNR
jgi:hypothetical protein